MTLDMRSLVSAVVALLAAATWLPAAEKPPSPFVRLFDTQAASSAPLSAEAVAKRTRWLAVPENDLAHRFTGDAAFLNDKLAVVLRRRGAGAEVYSRTPAGWKRRSLLAPGAAPGDAAGAFSSLRIAENTPAAVMLEATHETRAGKPVTGRFRLTTGIAVVEFRAGRGTDRLRLRDRIRHVVVPELFANDFIVSPDSVKYDRVGIPAENTLLALLGQGEGIGVCVWRSVEQNADAILAGTGEQRAIRACEIECDPNQPVWYGLLEAEGIWHERSIAADGGGKTTPLDWEPPFAAKWRGDFVGPGEEIVSLDLREVARSEQPLSRVPQLVGRFDPLLGVPRWVVVEPVSVRPWPEGSYPLLFYLESGRVFMHLPKPVAVSGSTSAPARRQPLPHRLVVYPIDRSRATPLTVFCPIDVMRNALGVGVCQYVLDTEGLSQDGPITPAEVGKWLEKLFRRKRDRREAEAIRQRLGAMRQHVRRVAERIKEYDAAIGRAAKLCEAGREGRDSGIAALAEQLKPSAGETWAKSLDPKWVVFEVLGLAEAHDHGEFAENLTGGIVALVDRPEAEGKVAKLAEQVRYLRYLASAQDLALAEARMVLRRMKQKCRTFEPHGPKAGEFAAKIRSEVDKMLRKKRTDK